MSGKNEGEGNRTAARRYNEAAQKTAKKGVQPDAEPKSEQERKEMEQAEEAGRSRAKEVDPSVERDFKRPTKSTTT
jgi:hypothetical protein